VSYIGEYERTLVAEAKRHGADGVICGHIHHAAIHDDFGIRYVNCGDWVESCTAVAENFDGRLELISWTGEAMPDLEAPEFETTARANEPQAA
jgi:UDP-2,3-diacylglucosamine pyrophosphatase LpxH